MDLLLPELVVQELVVQASMMCLQNETFIENGGIQTVADGVLGVQLYLPLGDREIYVLSLTCIVKLKTVMVQCGANHHITHIVLLPNSIKLLQI